MTPLNLNSYQYVGLVATSFIQGSQSLLKREQVPENIPGNIFSALFPRGFTDTIRPETPLSHIQKIDWLNQIKDQIQIDNKKRPYEKQINSLYRFHSKYKEPDVEVEKALDEAYIASIKKINALIDIERTKIIVEGTIFNEPSEPVNVIIHGINIECRKMAFNQSRPLREALQADLESPVENFEEQAADLTSILELAAYTEKTETINETETLIITKKVKGVSIDQTIQKIKEGKFHKRVLEHVLSKINTLQHTIDDQLKQTLEKLIDNYEPPYFSAIIHKLEPEVVSAVLHFLYTGEKKIPEGLKTEFLQACESLELPTEEESEAFLKVNTPQIELPTARSLYKLEELQKKKLLEEAAAAAEEERKTTSLKHVLKGVGDVTLGLLKVALATAFVSVSAAVFMPKYATYIWMEHYFGWEGAQAISLLAFDLMVMLLTLSGLNEVFQLSSSASKMYYKIPEMELHIRKLNKSLKEEINPQKKEELKKQIEKYKLQQRDAETFLWELGGKRDPNHSSNPFSPLGMLRSVYNDFASASGHFQKAWKKWDAPAIEHG